MKFIFWRLLIGYSQWSSWWWAAWPWLLADITSHPTFIGVFFLTKKCLRKTGKSLKLYTMNVDVLDLSTWYVCGASLNFVSKLMIICCRMYLVVGAFVAYAVGLARHVQFTRPKNVVKLISRKTCNHQSEGWLSKLIVVLQGLASQRLLYLFVSPTASAFSSLIYVFFSFVLSINKLVFW